MPKKNGTPIWRSANCCGVCTGEFAAHHQRRKGHDRAAADLAAAHFGAFDAGVIAPFAGVVEVGLALLQELAMARERIDADVACHIKLRGLVDVLFAIRPFDGEPFLLEQALVIGDELGEPLERGGRFQSELFVHGAISVWQGSGRTIWTSGRMPGSAAIEPI